MGLFTSPLSFAILFGAVVVGLVVALSGRGRPDARVSRETVEAGRAGRVLPGEGRARMRAQDTSGWVHTDGVCEEVITSRGLVYEVVSYTAPDGTAQMRRPQVGSRRADRSLVGQRVTVLVNPAHPNECVVPAVQR